MNVPGRLESAFRKQALNRGEPGQAQLALPFPLGLRKAFVKRNDVCALTAE
jgi:hypothetical protein